MQSRAPRHQHQAKPRVESAHTPVALARTESVSAAWGPRLTPDTLLALQRISGNQSVLRYLQRHANQDESELERSVQRTPTSATLKGKFQQPAEVVNARRAPMLTDAIDKVQAAMTGLGALIDQENTNAASPERANIVAANQTLISTVGGDVDKKANAAAFNKRYLATAARLPGLAVPRAMLQGQVDALGPASTIAEVRAVAATVDTFAETVKQVVVSRASASGVQVTVSAALPLLDQAEAITGDVVGQFGSNMRDHINDSLGLLPASHVAGNASFAGIEDATANPAMGAASFYSYDTGKLSIVRPDSVISGKMSEFTYTALSRGVGWQLDMMDAGAMAGYEGIAGNEDLKLGKRKVMGGQKSAIQPHINALAQGKLVDWTLRHETGHAVDEQIKFTDKRAKIASFGGWRQHQGAEIAAVMLQKAAGLSVPSAATLRPLLAAAFELTHGDVVTELKRIEGLLATPPSGLGPFTNAFDGWAKTASKADREALAPAVRWARVASAVPWTTADGQTAALQVNGRVYQLDHYGTWVSYLAGARANAVSSYQFSTPGEWFAEAYAAFYDPEKKTAGALNDATRNWFLQNLGAPRRKGTEADGALSNNGVLGTLGDLDDEVDPQALGLSLASELPADLKSGGDLMAGLGAGVSGMAGGRQRAGALSRS